MPPAVFRRSLVWLWALLPAMALLLFVLAVLVLDPAALLRLAWACAAGLFGRFAQIGVSALLLLAAGLTLWAFWPDTAAPATRRGRAPAATRRRTSPADAPTGAAQPRTTRPASPSAAIAAPTVASVSSPATPAATADTPAALAAVIGAEPGKQRRRRSPPAAASTRQRSGVLAGPPRAAWIS